MHAAELAAGGVDATGLLQVILDLAESQDSFEDAMRQAYRAVLTSPHFLYRMAQPGPLDYHAVATRLALWGDSYSAAEVIEPWRWDWFD